MGEGTQGAAHTFWHDQSIATGYHDLADEIGQLAYIAGPVIAQEQVKQLTPRGEPAPAAARGRQFQGNPGLLATGSEIVQHQLTDILGMLAQRRQADFTSSQPVLQGRPETASLGIDVCIRRGNNAHIGTPHRAADQLDLALL